MRYKTISDCPPERTVKIWDTWEDAYAALQCIDMCGCGGQCIGKTGHRILPITNETKDFQSTELCHACQTPMVRRVRIIVAAGQSDFSRETIANARAGLDALLSELQTMRP